MVLIYTGFSGILLNHTAGFSGLARVLISILVISVPAFFMGMPFPLGLKQCEIIDKRNVAWAWGINGCVSVISTGLAAILVVETGMKFVMLISVFSYFAAFMFSILLLRKQV